ncbi:MAG: hypothetical protein VKL39_09495 [Leptolyngbyaceae bacterium]|nr:hypothetical protein [Leptolyngbyaceae bacterium]
MVAGDVMSADAGCVDSIGAEQPTPKNKKTKAIARAGVDVNIAAMPLKNAKMLCLLSNQIYLICQGALGYI